MGSFKYSTDVLKGNRLKSNTCLFSLFSAKLPLKMSESGVVMSLKSDCSAGMLSVQQGYMNGEFSVLH